MLQDKVIKYSLLIIALSIAYYLVIYLPNKQSQELELQKQQYQDQIDAQNKKDQEANQKQQDAQKQELVNKQSLDTCFNMAEANYHATWRSDCRSQGLLPDGCGENYISVFSDNYEQQVQKCSCSLSLALADSLNTTLKNDKDLCLNQFPQN